MTTESVNAIFFALKEALLRMYLLYVDTMHTLMLTFYTSCFEIILLIFVYCKIITELFCTFKNDILCFVTKLLNIQFFVL